MIRSWFSAFMTGRYGPDHLGVVMVICAVILRVASAFKYLGFLSILAYFMILIAIFRMLSRNIQRRRAENDRFITIFWPIRRRAQLFVQRLKNRRSYKFFRCPACGNILRVPRGKGRVKITCPKCGERFERKT